MNWLDGAELFDSWRVVPRIVLLAYGTWLAYVTDRLIGWYMGLPIAAQTTQASSFCIGIITAITAIAGLVFKVYSENSRSWDVPSSRSTVVATETVTK